MPETVLVTGFGPFGPHKINASWESVKLLPPTIEDKFLIIREEIPVSYAIVDEKLPELWTRYTPQLVVHVGVSTYINKLTIETCANRQGYSKEDFLGQCKSHVCTIGEECLWSGFDLREICDRLNFSKNSNVQACISANAGRYLCEYIYYTSLSIDNSRTLFIHVPPLDNPYSVNELAQAILQVIKCALEQLNRRNREENKV